MHPVLPEAEPSEVLSEAGYDQSRKSYVPLLPASDYRKPFVTS
jgi:hypothetical protein